MNPNLLARRARATLLCILAGLAASAMLPVASAHTHLESTVPADQARLATAPTELTLTFAAPVMLVSVNLAAADGSKTALTVGEAHADVQKVPLPALHAGSYTVAWRAQGHDGHVVSGEFHFEVGATPAH